MMLPSPVSGWQRPSKDTCYKINLSLKLPLKFENPFEFVFYTVHINWKVLLEGDLDHLSVQTHIQIGPMPEGEKLHRRSDRIFTGAVLLLHPRLHMVHKHF